MFAKSSLFVFLAVALSATSVLASAGAGPNANAQVGRRFESDTSDSVSGPQSKERPDCSEKVINVRGVKKVIRNDSHLKSCPEADDLRTGDEDETIEDTGNTGGTFVGDEVDGTEELAEEDEERPRLPGQSEYVPVPSDDEDDEDDEDETSRPNESDDDEEDTRTGGTGYESYDDPDEGEYDGPGRDQGI